MSHAWTGIRAPMYAQCRAMEQQTLVSISVDSHHPASLVAQLLSDMVAYFTLPVEVILTLNVPEELPFDVATFRFPIRVVSNTQPKGFGANHNAAHVLANGEYFCVMNPDIRFAQDPLPTLIESLREKSIGVTGPLIVNPTGGVEDSARKFPTPVQIIKKALFGASGPEYIPGTEPLYPDWIAGMFMVFRTAVFRDVGGFDEGYFLYYEDVDLCWRLRQRDYGVLLISSAMALHDARRQSHRNIRYMAWHLSSMLRFFWKRASSARRG